MSGPVNKKRVMALHAIRRRAESGDVEALATLGHVLITGELGKADPVGAWVALARATEAGHAGARAELEQLSKSLSASDRASAEAELSATGP